MRHDPGDGMQLRRTDGHVLVVHESPAFSEALALMLRRAGVPAAHATFASAGHSAGRRRPRVVLLDGDTGDGRPLVCSASIRALPGDTRILLLTAHEGVEAQTLAARAGADAVLPKTARRETLLRALTQPHLQEHASWRPGTRAPGGATALLSPEQRATRSLTNREREVLQALIAGLRVPVIAERLTISPHTVRTHIQRVLDKLGVGSRLEAVAMALRAGIGPTVLDGRPTVAESRAS